MHARVSVNGVDVEREVDDRMLLVDFIRDELGLTGTHLGCEDGKCGACTIRLDGDATKCCMVLAAQADGARIETVESLADGVALDPLQESFREHHGLQCGFCTPGFLMTAHELLARNPSPTDSEVRAGLAGNVCRCTGYTNPVAAVVAAGAAAGTAEAIS